MGEILDRVHLATTEVLRAARYVRATHPVQCETTACVCGLAELHSAVRELDASMSSFGIEACNATVLTFPSRGSLADPVP